MNCFIWQAYGVEKGCCKKVMHCESCEVPKELGYVHNGKKFVRKFIRREDFEFSRARFEEEILDIREELDTLEALVQDE